MAVASVKLVDRAARGDKAAYSRLVERYKSMVYAVAYDRLGSIDDARDVAQDAFVAAYVHLHALDDRAKFGGWLRRITVNACAAYIRRKPETAVLDRMLTAPDGVDRLLTGLAVEQALGCLTSDTRLTLTLYYFHAYSTADIAEFLDIPATAVKSRLRDGRARLRKEMIGMFEDSLAGAIPTDFASRVSALIDVAIDGNAGRARELLTSDPSLVHGSGEVDAGAREFMARNNAADGWSPLHLAAHYGNLPVVKLLVEFGADIEAVSRNAIGNRPISAAAWGNRLEVVEYLIAIGAIVDAPNAQGNTALQRAVQAGRVSMADLLLKSGADPRRLNGEGRTAFEIAEASGAVAMLALFSRCDAHHVGT